MAKAIEIQNFSYSYPDGTAALHDVNLSIEHGEKVVLLGPNGAGKSSILLATGGFITGSGRIFIDGIELDKKNMPKIRSLIGCCLENPDDQLFMPTLFDDVAFGPLNMGFKADEVKQRVIDALAKVGLAEKANKAPHHLSAGQKRAAAIATVISMSPKIITFDEPDGSLDPRHRNNLVKLLNSLSQTFIIATCNMHFASQIAQRAVLVDNGRIIADGSINKILTNDRLMSEHGLEAI